MLLSLVPMVASAAGVGETFTYGDFNYMVNADGATVTITSIAAASLSGTVVIPSTVSDGTNQYTVTKLGAAFKGTDSAVAAKTSAMTKLVMADTITQITVTAPFYACRFTEIHLSSALEMDGTGTKGQLNNTFNQCNLLYTVNIPAAITQLYGTFYNGGTPKNVIIEGTRAGAIDLYMTSSTANAHTFKDASASVNFYVTYTTNPGSLFTRMGSVTPTYIYYEDVYRFSIKGDGTAKIDGLLPGRALGETVVIPETLGGKTVSELYFYALRDNKVTKRFTMPDTVTTIDSATFYGWSSLEDVHLSTALTNGGAANRLQKTFYFCSKLTSVEIPAGIKECYGTFNNNSGVRTVYITGTSQVDFYAGSGTAEARAWANGTTGITIYYPYNGTAPTRTSASGSFTANVIQQEPPAPPTISFTSGDFNYTTNGDLSNTGVTLTSIAADALSGEVTVPEKVTYEQKEYTVTRLGDAFKNQGTKTNSMTSLTLPDTITAFTGTGTFYDCKFTSIHLPANLTGDASGAGYLTSTFHFCSNLTTVTLPAGITKCYGTFGSGANGLATSGVKTVHITSKSAVNFYGSSGTVAARAWKDGTAGITIYYPTDGTKPINTGTSFTATVLKEGEEPVVTGFEAGDFNYSVKAGTTTVSAIGFSSTSDKSGAKVLPETVKYGNTTYTVVEVGYAAFANNKGLTSFVMPDTVTTVGTNIFYGCTSLNYVHLSDSLTNAGASNQLVGTFYGCKALKTAIIPAGIKSLPKTFYDSGIENVVLKSTYTELPKGSSNEYIPFLNPESVNIFYPSNGSIGGGYEPYITHRFIYDGAVAYKLKEDNTLTVVSSLPGYTLPEEVVIPAAIGALEINEIEEGALSDEDGIVSVTMPDSITEVGEGAFAGCDSLESVTLSKGIEGELVNTFADCTSLQAVTIPEGVTALDGTFNGCTVLENIKFAQSLTTLKNMALYDTALVDITVPDTITTITDGACGDGTVFPIGCTLIVRAGSAALDYAVENNINYIIKPDVEYVEKGGNAELNKAWFRLVGEYEVPESVEINGETYDVVSIANDAFEDQDALTVLSIPDSLTGISNDSFNGCTNDDFAVRVNSDTDAYATVKTLSVNYIVDDEGTGLAYKKFTSKDGWEIYGTANDTLLEGDVSINAFDDMDVISIGDAAFALQSEIESITMVDTITSIGKFAFADCISLTDATLSEGAEGMLDSTFENCVSLENVSIPSKITELKNTYNGCSALKRVIIPENITAIYDKTFANCTELETVVIPETVTTFDSIVGFKDETQEEAEYVNTNNGKKWVDNPFMGATNEYLAICGVRGSAAEEFAYSSGIKFIDVTKGDYPVEYTPVTDNALDVSVRDIYGNGDVALIVALYDEEGSLVYCEPIQTNFDEQTVCAENVALPGYNDSRTVQILLWNNYDVIEPVDNAKTVEEPEKIKIMILGNSISNHGPSASVGWFPVAPDPETSAYQAMAATSFDKDFAHIVLNKAREVNKNAEIKIVTCWSLESDFDQWETIIPRDYQAAVDYDADIIIAQFGENIKNNSGEGSISGSFDNDHEFNSEIYANIVKAFMKQGKDVPVVVVTSMMSNKSVVLDAKQKAAADNGWGYVNLCNDPNFSESKNSAYYLTPNQIVEGLANGTFREGVEIGSGVYVHPGNNGMRAMGYNLWRYIEPIVTDMTFNK